MITWWAAGPLMVGCAGVAIWGFWPLVRLVGSVGLPFGYVPLEQAAGKLFGQMQGTAAAEFARRSSDSPAEILNWFAYWMAQHGVRIFGKNPPSPRLQEIPKIEIGSRLNFRDGASRLQRPGWKGRAMLLARVLPSVAFLGAAMLCAATLAADAAETARQTVPGCRHIGRPGRIPVWQGLPRTGHSQWQANRARCGQMPSASLPSASSAKGEVQPVEALPNLAAEVLSEQIGRHRSRHRRREC